MGLQICRLSKRMAGSSLERVGVAWKPSSWLQLASQLSKSAQFKESTSAQASCRQIAQIAQGEGKGKEGKEKKAKKRKTDADGENAAAEEMTRRKKAKKKAKETEAN